MTHFANPSLPGLSLYLHIPFCRARCTYCAFNTYTGLDALIPSYVAALGREIELASERAPGWFPPARTLYFGGGTPSLLGPREIALLIDTASRRFHLLREAEITLEVNPGTADHTRLAGFRAAGVNRVSLGVQSAHPAELELFGREHTFGEAAEAFVAARRAGFDNLSIDLIYGAPHQTRSGWRETLDAVLTWEPDHLSLYSLSLEPGTRLAWQVEQLHLPAPDPDLAADMYDDASERLQLAGFSQYEISNWARPGFECQHNRQYWVNEPFYGFGAGAHGFVNNVRYWNVRSIRDYIARVARQGSLAPFLPPAVDAYDVIDEPMARAETLILNLRLVNEGVSAKRFVSRFGLTPEQAFGREIAQLISLGLLSRSGDSLRLSQRAYLISNQVFVRFMPEA